VITELKEDFVHATKRKNGFEFVSILGTLFSVNVNDHYAILLHFISKVMTNIKIKFDRLNLLLIDLTNITVFIVAFTLFFDLP